MFRIPSPARFRRQAGSVLLEGLIAIVIFSVGILAIVGMQATAVKNSTDAKNRTDAALLANDLIAQMWAGNRAPATLQANFATGGTKYAAWAQEVQAAFPGSPAPTVTVDAATGLVTVVVFWKLPSESASSAAHTHTVIAQVR